MADYCTAADVKAAGRLDITSSQYDAVLASLCTAASRWIDRVCCPGVDDAFAQATDATRRFGWDYVSGGALHLDAPLLSITTLTNGDGSAVASGYQLWPRNGRSYRKVLMLSTGPGWSFGDDEDAVVVVGKWGLATTCPAPVKEAAAMLAGWLFKRYQLALADATANGDLGEIVYGSAMPKQVLALLAPYGAGGWL